ncbi:hypothetical protein [Planomonospora algeriensis]
MSPTLMHASDPGDEQVVGYVVVDVSRAEDRSRWMTPRMRATAEQAAEDLAYWDSGIRGGRRLELRVAKLVLLDEPEP